MSYNTVLTEVRAGSWLWQSLIRNFLKGCLAVRVTFVTMKPSLILAAVASAPFVLGHGRVYQIALDNTL
jgi:hypothetical protein